MMAKKDQGMSATAVNINRPLSGMDIVRFQGRHGMDKDDVTYFLGIANFKKKCEEPKLDYALELLMRLFDEDPTPPPWKKDRLRLPELFQQMYGKKLEVFKGSEHEVEAKVDLQNRFSKLLGRSKGRAYRWLDGAAIRGNSSRTHSDVTGILGKLTQAKNPGETLERMGALVWALRGEDIDETFPIPTLRNPPKRGKRGRRPAQKVAEEPQKTPRKISAKGAGRVQVVKKTKASGGKNRKS